METSEVLVTSLSHWTVLEGDKEPADTQPFELYLAMQVEKIRTLIKKYKNL